tara:strand:- start:193 stop:465 length:273 start_codon:yes stop_codon:yes gene_type:complete
MIQKQSMEPFEKKGLDEKLEILKDTDELDLASPWHKDLFQKSLILLPIIFVLIGLCVVNNPQNLQSLLGFIVLVLGCISSGLLLFFFMGK